MLQGSSDDESETTEGPIFTTYDSVFAPDGMLGTGADFFMDLENLHPPPVHIIQLWQIYLDNVHPLLRCLHAPTVQQKLLKGVNAISTMPLSMHVLLFGIYSSAVASMRVAVCLDTFGEDQYVLTCRYTAATRYVLKKIGFLRTTDITVQQAVVINLVRAPNYLKIPRNNVEDIGFHDQDGGPAVTALHDRHHGTQCSPERLSPQYEPPECPGI